ncbi:transcriptional regulator, TetR family [Burkholderia sp. H160]|nr:transcriptional regulator, TetR family [Burkholderia sp. H160]
MRHTRQQALETRSKILDAAELVFFKHGAAHASLDDIARAAGVTRGAIYGHFSNKAAVFHAIFERAALPLDPFFVPLHQEETDPLGRLRADLHRQLRSTLRADKVRHLYSIALTRCENSMDSAAFDERVRTATQQAQVHIEAALSRAVARGQLHSDLNVRQAASFVHAILTGFFRRSLLASGSNHTEIDVDEIIEITFRFLAGQAEACVDS